MTGKWVVQNWDGSVAGVKDGDRIRFDDLSKNRNKNATTGGVDGESKSSHIISRPFAKIDGVSNQSPATDAGIVTQTCTHANPTRLYKQRGGDNTPYQ